jgi:hypothetical protein
MKQLRTLRSLQLFGTPISALSHDQDPKRTFRSGIASHRLCASGDTV